ncbi:MAG: CBS domain-containing protein [Saprospiraceae bacterium]|nr:CBS domain-containing protein [Saprospiraceae bacterium]
MDPSDSVRNHMATKLITFTADVDIREAMRIILKNNISGAPVVDKGGMLIGMLSESDCIKVVMDGPYNNQPGGTGVVGDFMSRDVATISPDKSLLDLAYQFLNSKFRRFPVIEHGQLVGQISRSDILRAVIKMRPHVDHVPSSWKGREPRE